MLDCKKPKDDGPKEPDKNHADTMEAELQLSIVIAMDHPIDLKNVGMTKIVLGVWDCGVPDKDDHEDGLSDYKDIYSEDPLKTEPRADMDGNKMAATVAPWNKTQVRCRSGVKDTNVLRMSP